MSSPAFIVPTPRRRLSLFTAFDSFGDDLSSAMNAKKDHSPATPASSASSFDYGDNDLLEGPPPPPPSPVSWSKSIDYFDSQKSSAGEH